MNKPNFEKKDEIKEGVKYDSEKPRFDLTPPLAWLELAKVLTFGAKKYSPNNWKKIENIEERYTAAALRHIQAFMSGEIEDEESGLHHLAHAMCCLSFILEKQKQFCQESFAKNKECNMPKSKEFEYLCSGGKLFSHPKEILEYVFDEDETYSYDDIKNFRIKKEDLENLDIRIANKIEAPQIDLINIFKSYYRSEQEEDDYICIPPQDHELCIALKKFNEELKKFFNNSDNVAWIRTNVKFDWLSWIKENTK